MEREKNSDKILKDAKAASSEPVAFGPEKGQGQIDDAHTVNNAAFNVHAMYLQDDLTPGESRQ
ncbi:MAG TPA: hypothetical protein VD969_08490 [Symbiobacteriaceae bacterium]|nr:hypothetical protein [Symbiobacteriaceae bacterium]